MKFHHFFLVLFALPLVVLSQNTLSASDVDAHTVAWWHFDEGAGNILHDASPYHNDGTIHNCRWVAGKFGSALHFDGLTSYVILPNAPSLKLTTEFTLEAWFLLDTLHLVPSPYNSAGGIMSNIGPYPSGGGFDLGYVDPGGIQFDDRSANSVSNFSGFTPIQHAHQFYHVGFVYKQTIVNGNPVVTVKTYLDGALTDSSILSAPIQYDNTPNFYIGTNMDGRAVGYIGVREFPGIIDEIRISNIARDPGEFGMTHLSVPAVVDFGTTLPGTSVTRQLHISNTSFRDTITVTSVSLSGDHFDVDITPFVLPPLSSHDLTVTYNAGAVEADTGSITLTSVNADFGSTHVSLHGKASPYSSGVDSNTVALWHFDEAFGNILHDASPNYNDGTIHDCQWVMGKFGSALHFNGLTSYAILSNQSSLRTEHEFTLEAWTLLDTLDFPSGPGEKNFVIVSNLGPYPYGGGYQLYCAGSPLKYYFHYRTPGASWVTTTGVPVPDAHHFHHLAAIYHALGAQVTVKMYVDGELRDSVVFNQAIQYDNTPYFYIGTNEGGRANGSWGIREFPGIIDEVRISRIARSPQEFGQTQLVTSTGLLSFGAVKLGQTASMPLTISNSSFSSSLHVDSIISSNPVFTLDESSLTLSPTAARPLTVTYAPTQAVVDTGMLTFYPAEMYVSPVSVHVTGKGFAPSASPMINTIRDVPGDQGRQVRIVWYPSMYDSQTESLRVSEYTILRRVDDAFVAKSLMAGKPQGTTFAAHGTRYVVLGGDLWDFVARWPALRFDQYSYVAPTLYNATALGIRWSVFRVVAQTADGDLFFSDPDSGYSDDNEVPPPPGSLQSTLVGNQIRLAWSGVAAPDVEGYRVYRSASPYVVPSIYARIGVSATTRYTDSAIVQDSAYYYTVTAVDSSGNESVQSNVTGGIRVLGVKPGSPEIPSAYVLAANYPNPFNPSTSITFGVPVKSRVKLTVFDLLGRQVAVLIDEVMEPGFLARSWTPSGASGIYFCTMEAARADNSLVIFSATQKMLFLK